MGSIIKHKLRMLIILMMVLGLNTGTETNDGPDWFATYGEERDAGENGVLETGIGEGDVGEGITKTERSMSKFV